MNNLNIDLKTQGNLVNGYIFVSPKDTMELLNQGAFLLDVREEYNTNARMFPVKNIYYLPYSKINEFIEQIPAGITIIVADDFGIKCREVLDILKKAGYENCAAMAGGMVEWERDGLPITKDKNKELNGPCLCMLRPRK